jgi:hypothetical protein
METFVVPTANTGKVNSGEVWLYRIGCLAAVVALVVFRRWLSSEFMLLRALGVIRFGPDVLPNSAVGWFTLLHAHRLLGFTLLNGFDMVTFVLAGAVYLALYAALRRTDQGFMILALALSFAGIAIYIASNPAFPMMKLSSQYAVATSEVVRSTVAAAGEQVIASKNPLAIGQNVAFVFFNAGGLILSLVMLRSGIFSRRTAWLGMLFNAFALGFPLGVALARGNQFVPGAAWMIAAVLWVFWYIGIARSFARLARGRIGTHSR